MNQVYIHAFADEASPKLDEQIQAMLRNGLHGLEIRGVDGENVSAISLDKAREVRHKMDDHGLVTYSIGSPIGKIDIVKDDFRAHMDVLRHTLEVADILGAKYIRMFSFYIPAGEKAENYRNQVMDQLHEMAEAADGSGIRLCHENEKGIYGDLAPRCLEILREVPEIGGIFDPANFVQSGQDTAEAWELLKNDIVYMHIKDALPDGRVVPAGKGAGHVKEIVRAFMEKGGNCFTVEPHLATFSGLAGLEREGEKSVVGEYVYRDNQEAFDVACGALKDILETI